MLHEMSGVFHPRFVEATQCRTGTLGERPEARHVEVVSCESERVVVAIDEDDAMRRVLARVLAWRGFRAVLLRGREATVDAGV